VIHPVADATRLANESHCKAQSAYLQSSHDPTRNSRRRATIARLIRALAEYERLADKVVLEEARLHEHLFGPGHAPRS